MLIIYALAIFVSALLLFIVEPMFARMILPLLGGSPSVWNTAVVFYQAMLLLGYVYAHAATKWLGVRRQAALHIVLLLLPLLALPIGIPAGWSPPTQANPALWLLALLLVAVGVPFFVVSASSPLLQTWFAATRHRAAADPYFLYAASNVGSMLALLAYPLLIEPRLGLREQSWIWAGGYLLLAALIGMCAVLVRRAPASPALATLAATAPAPAGERLSWRRRGRWVLLAFVPSSLMLSVTTYLSTNIAPIPLLWVIPLAIYLLTFILVFMRRPILPHTLVLRALPIAILPLIITLVAQATQPIGLLIGLHLAVFFVATMACHGAIARDRPPPTQLTEFYLWMSAGGVLGGLFNALLAPLLFTTVVEYPLVLVLACVLLETKDQGLKTKDQRQEIEKNSGALVVRPSSFVLWPRLLDLGLPAALGALVALAILGARGAGMSNSPLGLGLMFGVPSLVCFSFSRRPLRFGLAIGAILLASTLYTSGQGQVLHAERSFFGIHRVLLDATGQFHSLAHGSTRHGMQSLDPANRNEPLTYYSRSGPIGQVLADLTQRRPGARVAAIGLGAGSLACYKQPGQQWTFYEIDPSVVRIAREPAYFTYLQDCAPDAGMVLGDARLSLASAPDGGYDLIVLDAYSSDSIPMHLITREALALYLRKLAPGGVLAFHISNLYLDLKPALGNLAADAGLASLARDDLVLSAE
ncbi:MAG TPA: fused MFS/spermidine synthase, partial [Roseiflexaceae bacterium]|nr:fused MFS/spermidine synthase [Roseiflexaceae bacterium]